MDNQNTDIAALLYSLSAYSDESSYRRIFDIFFPPLKRFANTFLKHPEQAEEVASDVLIAVWENRHKLADIDNIRVYLYVIAKNKCLNVLKSRQSHPIISLDDISIDIAFTGKNPEQLCINSEVRKKIEKTVNALPQRCKLVFKLVKEENLSYREVAAILNISVKTVDAQLVIAFKKITEAVKLDYAGAF
jgi:RNA polymerase sigma-70 factor (family 1)